MNVPWISCEVLYTRLHRRQTRGRAQVLLAGAGAAGGVAAASCRSLRAAVCLECVSEALQPCIPPGGHGFAHRSRPAGHARTPNPARTLMNRQGLPAEYLLQQVIAEAEEQALRVLVHHGSLLEAHTQHGYKQGTLGIDTEEDICMIIISFNF